MSWCEPAQTAGFSPIVGSGEAPHSRPWILAHSFIIQMPSQVMATRFWRNAWAWASLATLGGLKPCLTWPAYHSSASTPASEAKVASVVSSL